MNELAYVVEENTLAWRVVRLHDAAPVERGRFERAQEAKLLLLPGEMGQTCKLMALTVEFDRELRGFANDERHRLQALRP